MILLSAVCAALLTAAPAAPAAAQDAASDHWDARITAVTGEAVVHPAGGGDEVTAEADMPLEEGDRITTAGDATAEVSLDGGSLITVRENSDFTLEKTAKSDSMFSLALGSILAKIQKLGSQSLSVRTPTSVAAVRGTEFGVDSDANAQSHVGVFDEGRVEVKSAAGGTEVLTPNQETSVKSGEAPQKAVPLRRFAARRALMRAHLRRLQIVHKNWKPLPPARRQQLRAQTLTRMRAHRQNILRQREKQREQRHEQPMERERRRQRRQPRRQPRRKGARRTENSQ